MRVIFILPLTVIALYESTRGRHWVTDWLRSDNEGDENYSQSRDPEADAEEDGRKISKVSFEELIKSFPNTAQVRLFLKPTFEPNPMYHAVE